MRFAGIVGQPRATEFLSRALDSGRFSPSLIFHGPGGVGKLSTALELCRSLICGVAGAEPCGSCSACRRIDERQLRHPGVRLILPEKISEFQKGTAWREGAAGIDLQETQAEAVRNPVWTILIDRIRQGRSFLQRRPVEGRYSVLVVDQAHRMGAEAANALLKILEEPPEHGALILITTALHTLLPTIRSRCQTVAFQPVPRKEIASFLATRENMNPDEIQLRAALSDGRIGTALEFDLEAFRSRRETLFQIVESLIDRGDPGLAVARAEQVAKKSDNLDADLRILMALLRDLMLVDAGESAQTNLVNHDLAPRLRRLSPCAAGRAPYLIEALESTIDGIRRKGNRQLLVENFFLALLPRSGIAALSQPS